MLGQHHHLLLVDSECVYSQIRAPLRVVNIHIIHYSCVFPFPCLAICLNSLRSAHLTRLPARPAAGGPDRARGERGFHPNLLQVAAQDRNHCVWPAQPQGQQQVL